MKRCFLSVLMIFFLLAAPHAFAAATLLKSSNWDPVAKNTINELFTLFGNTSPAYNPAVRPYAVLDFDNTVSILDFGEQLAIYQLLNLRFAIAPEDMYGVLTAGIANADQPLKANGNALSLAQVAKDAAAAYARLWHKGYVSAKKTKLHLRKEWLESDDWQEFAAKARWMYSAIAAMNRSLSRPWLTYWFTGMTPQQVNNLAAEAWQAYKRKSRTPRFWGQRVWTSPADYPGSLAGQLSVRFSSGVSVSPEMKELIAALDANGFDVWLCSALSADALAALTKAIPLPKVKGVLGITPRLEKGRYIPEYDSTFHPPTQGGGKAETVDRLLRPLYQGKGPVMVALDGQDDFSLATEFADTAMGLVINRVRKDDTSLLSAIAVHQKERSVSLAAAIAAGEIRYVLQGRDENGGRFWPKSETRLLGNVKPALLSESGTLWLSKLREGTPARDLINLTLLLTDDSNIHHEFKSRGNQ